jgi:predicted flavoprotein YhiN
VEAQRSGFLFTHRGYSGPSVLDLSHHAVHALEAGGTRPRVVVDWTGEVRV